MMMEIEAVSVWVLLPVVPFTTAPTASQFASHRLYRQAALQGGGLIGSGLRIGDHCVGAPLNRVGLNGRAGFRRVAKELGQLVDMELLAGGGEELLDKIGMRADLLAVVNVPPVGFSIVGDEDYRPPRRPWLFRSSPSR
jgi:hypothetical protein